jgi:hypothetical protein
VCIEALRMRLLLAALALLVLTAAQVPSAHAHGGHGHRSAAPPKSKPPFKIKKRSRIAVNRRSGAGWPEHAAQQQCTVLNGGAEAEGQALRAGLFNWITADDGSGITTIRHQDVYFRYWTGTYDANGTLRWAAGNWSRLRNGYPYNAEAFVDGRWRSHVYAPTWNLPFAVGTYIGGSSFIRLPAARQSRQYYSEWWWQSTDGAYTAGPHWDAWGWSSAC